MIPTGFIGNGTSKVIVFAIPDDGKSVIVIDSPAILLKV